MLTYSDAAPAKSFDSITSHANARAVWFYLDIPFYIEQCIGKGIGLDSIDTSDVIAHFISYSGTYKLSPNPFFDEERYRKRYSWVGADIKAKRCRSGFEHYLLNGVRENASPHWLFEPIWYKNKYPDVNERALELAALDDAYSHYLIIGTIERRSGSFYTNFVNAVAGEDRMLRSAAALRHMLLDPELLEKFLSPVFNTDWFSAKYGLRRHTPTCFQFYLDRVFDQRLSPSPFFDEAFYLNRYPEVAAELQAGIYASGYDHFLNFGRFEKRHPLPNFDPHYYLSANQHASEECDAENIDFFVHFLRTRGHRRPVIEVPYAKRHVDEEAGKSIYERRASLVANVATLAYNPLIERPDASVIVVTVNKSVETINALHSILANTKASFEFILFDNASNDAIAEFPSRFPHIKYIRSEDNIGFTVAVNQAAALATGRHIVLLNNDTEIGPGALDRAIGLLDADPSIGAVGGRIVRMHGLLQEAGSLIWRDGTCLGYGRDMAPEDGRADFMRDVDFCSGCFLVTPRALWNDLDGFDPKFAPAYYEETDYCVRVWAAGFRVVYDPRILVWHFEFGSSTLRDEPLALMRRNQTYFKLKHKNFLATRPPPHAQHIETARMSRVPSPRVLFIEDELPDASQGMGYVRSSDVAKALEAAAGHLTMCGLHAPKNGLSPRLRQAYGDRVEVLTDININNLADELHRRPGIYDVLWLSRTHNLAALRRLRAEVPTFFEGLRVILDTEAIAAARTAAQARLMNHKVDLDALLDTELEGMEFVDEICVVNELDRTFVQNYMARHGLEAPIHILGHAIMPKPSFPAYEETSKIVLVGSFFSQTGPNADAVRWFDRHVMPLLAQRWPAPPVLIAGYKAKAFVKTLEYALDYEVMSDLQSMDAVYQSARLMVAPTRFAGGIPYKVHEAAAHGVPVVMSELLGRQLGWADDPALGVVEDNIPEALADIIIKIYDNKAMWSDCQRSQTEHLKDESSTASFSLVVDRLVCRKKFELPTKVLYRAIRE